MQQGYKLPPHWRAQGGQVTVVSGTVYLGVGETTDLEKAKLLQTGGYAYLPATTHHYIVAREPAVVQLQTLGPLDLNYLNPAEDPRNK